MSEEKPVTLAMAQNAVQAFHFKFKFAVNKLGELREAKRLSAQNRDDLALRLAYEQKLGAWQDLGLQRVDLIAEELSEMIRGWRECDPIKLADGLGDLLYVVLGSCVAAGVEIAPIFETIQVSNMSKTPDSQFKPAKGPSYKEPEIERCLREQRLA